MTNLCAVVLAGGVGKRSWPITPYKAYFSLSGQPLLWYNLRNFSKLGISEVVLVANPKERAEVNKLAFPGLKITAVYQDKALGMADAMLRVESVIKDKEVFVINAEDLVEDQLWELMSQRLRRDTSFVVGKQIEGYFPGGYLKLKAGKLWEIVEKPKPNELPSKLINLVFHYFKDAKAFLEIIKHSKSQQEDIYEKALSVYAQQQQVEVLVYSGKWMPFKYPWHLLACWQLLAQDLKPYRGKNLKLAKNVILEGKIHLGDNVRILENTKIIGPCYIGNGTIVGNNNLIRGSHLGNNCVTGFNTDITRSVIGNNCWFHANYLGDSIICDEVSFGSGVVTANLRLDEQEIKSTVSGVRTLTGLSKLGAIVGNKVRIGSNTTIMPGVKIGANSLIGAGICLDQDVPDHSFCLAKPNYTVSENLRKI